MNRDAPTFRYLAHVFYRQFDTVVNVYCGLCELSALGNFYPILNLNELLSFAGVTFDLRKKENIQFKHALSQYSTLNVILDHSNPMLLSCSDDALLEEDERLNPFRRDSLTKRIRIYRERNNSWKEDACVLISQLQKETKKYCSIDSAEKSKDTVLLDFLTPEFRDGDIVVQPTLEDFMNDYLHALREILKTYPNNLFLK